MESAKMKKGLILAGVLIASIVGFYLALSYLALKWIEPQLQRAFGPGTTIDRIRFGMTSLSAHGLQWRDQQSGQVLLKVEEVKLYPSLPSLLKREVSLRRVSLIRPTLYFCRSRDGSWIGPWGWKGKQAFNQEGGQGVERERSTEKRRWRIGAIRMERGSIEIEDQKVASRKIILNDLDAQIGPMEYPSIPVRSSLTLKARGLGSRPGGEISIRGWGNPGTSEMALTVILREAELKLFEPYYRKQVSSKIDSGALDAEVHIAIQQGRFDLSGWLKLVGLKFQGEEGAFFYVPAKTLQASLTRRGERLTIPLKMSADLKDPRLNLQEVLLWKVGFSLAEALGFPVGRMEGVDLDPIH